MATSSLIIALQQIAGDTPNGESVTANPKFLRAAIDEIQRMQSALLFYATCGGICDVESAARGDVDLARASEVLTEDCGDKARAALAAAELR